MLQVENLSLSLNGLPVVQHVNFQVPDNEIVALMGPSGCGKSTILNMIAGFRRPDDGSIRRDSERISFVFQDDRLLPWKTVWDNIAIVDASPKSSREEIRQLIDEVGLTGFETYMPDQLSGGMKKRCGIARAFYYKAELLVMDEPFQGLDFCRRQEMLAMLMRVWEKRRTSILFVTHEVDEALRTASKIVILSERPARVVKEITLPAYGERGEKENEMQQIRKEVLESICCDKKVGPMSRFSTN